MPIRGRVRFPEHTNFWQVSEVLRTACADAELSEGVEVRRGQQVVADVRAANLDVRQVWYFLLNLW